jgi:hypothetical protein
MADPKKPVTQVKKDVFEVDEFADSTFTSMGYEKPFPSSLVETYRDFKKRKDMLHPGRLSAEGFALVTMIADMKG